MSQSDREPYDPPSAKPNDRDLDIYDPP